MYCEVEVALSLRDGRMEEADVWLDGRHEGNEIKREDERDS